MFFVYVLKSLKTGTRYVGSTGDVAGRLQEHNLGKCRYTRNRMPWIIAHQEGFRTLSEARKRENYLKSGQGREHLDKILKK
ncbi:MAG TPA: endonuclease [candidate division Zixibacteria bacterium]|jgi:predicted GIY-YIG superfamily endonuclease|nr:endonuclease [candidate division Zixibacteria bacterium]